LLWQFKGSATVTVAGQNVDLKEGDYYLIQAYVPFTVAVPSSVENIFFD
jgi:mannose-6-phosphate isomerase-like protein (cupin superfamily)